MQQNRQGAMFRKITYYPWQQWLFLCAMAMCIACISIVVLYWWPQQTLRHYVHHNQHLQKQIHEYLPVGEADKIIIKWHYLQKYQQHVSQDYEGALLCVELWQCAERFSIEVVNYKTQTHANRFATLQMTGKLASMMAFLGKVSMMPKIKWHSVTLTLPMPKQMPKQMAFKDAVQMELTYSQIGRSDENN